MKEPVDHILRPRLPWRSSADPALTECGYDASKVKTITRAEYAQRYKELGQQRCAMVTCMTCSQTAYRWSPWEDDPRKAIGREIEWETSWRRDERGERLKDELLAIAALIESHPEEFRQLIADNVARREWQARKPVAPKKATRRERSWHPL